MSTTIPARLGGFQGSAAFWFSRLTAGRGRKPRVPGAQASDGPRSPRPGLPGTPKSPGARSRLQLPGTRGRSTRLRQLLNGENCTVVLSDVVGFGARSRIDEDRRIIRETLFRITYAAMRGIPNVWSWEDRGDGLLMVIPPSIPTAEVVEHLHAGLPAALEEHNRTHPDSVRIQLRVAVNVGPVTSDDIGISGEAIIVAARLVEAPPFKKAMDETGANLGIVASTFIYETVVRHHLHMTGYSQVRVDVKESSILGWLKLFGGNERLLAPP
jgi:hypothetical protein